MRSGAGFRFIALALCVLGCVQAQVMPEPFDRELYLATPVLEGRDVFILQNLLQRASGTPPPINSQYDQATKDAVQSFQRSVHVSDDGIVGPVTAGAVLENLSVDGYKDDGATPESLGYKYKVHVPVHRNRSIETTASLISANGTVAYTFTVRAHGHDVTGPNTWPTYSNTPGLNSFSSDGNTPTGLSEFDLNSPESIPKLYGPYPVNRCVQGLRGNAKFLIPNVRDGLLLHTGEWPGWAPPMPLPNSDGCIHAYPESILTIWKTLVSWGVVVEPNTGGKLPYPYKPQGLISVELID